ncbi:metabotropic glutamate receptor 3 [Biomphalaria pfeifferi]|uniref:Metabotropic glutamate receptor 3 n=1 Tax=Biomphalaria pfeifferi TaxID=112525 RepID=A0AAD8BE79_BIOPF|nr:metabotropic glutamate receptor 3 [Biomphalaria pfeifferi]
MTLDSRSSMSSVLYFSLLVATSAVLIVAAEDKGMNKSSHIVAVLVDGLDRETGNCHRAENISSLGFLVQVFADLVNNVTNRTAISTVKGHCDEMDRVIQRTLELMGDNSVTDLVTPTSNLTSDTLLDIFNVFGVRVVEMMTGDVVRTSRRMNHYVAPQSSYWELETALNFIEDRNWTTVSLDSTASPAYRHLASRLLQNGNCIVSSSFGKRFPQIKTTEIDGIMLNQVNASGVLLYATPIDDVVKSFLKTKTSLNQTIFYLGENKRSRSWTVNNLSSQCNNGTSNVVCSFYNILSNQSFHSLREFQEVVKTLSVVINKQEIKQKCVHNNDSQACVLLSLLTVDLGVSPNRALYPLEPLYSMFVRYALPDGTIRFDNVTFNTPKRFPMNELSPLENSLIQWKQLTHASCEPYCRYCWKCIPLKTSTREMLRSGKGTLIIVGLFPLTVHSDAGPCSQKNRLGQAAAEVFLKTFQLNAGHEATLVQGVVIDTCIPADKPDTIVHDLESCKYAYNTFQSSSKDQTIIQPSNFVGYVQAFGSVIRSSSQPTITITKLGYSMTSDLDSKFADNLLVTLKHLNWTVLNVIVSDHGRFSSVYGHVRNSSIFHQFCFAESILLRLDNVSRPRDLNRIMTSLDKTTLFLLLTNAVDTEEALQHLRSSWAITRRKLSLIFTPLNDVPLTLHDIHIYAENVVYLKMSRKKITNAGNNTTNTGSDRSIQLNDESVLLLLDQATREFKSAVEDRGSSPGQPETVESFGLEVAVVNRESVQGHLVAKVDQTLTWLQPFRTQPFSHCSGWCPHCLSCRTRKNIVPSSLYIQGDLIVTGLFPLRKKGLGFFRCGDYNRDPDTLQRIFAFMFAVDTAKQRYPDLLPGVKIGGLILDSCSDFNTALKVVGDFETCSDTFGPVSLDSESYSDQTYEKYAYPIQNIGYVVDEQGIDIGQLRKIFEPSVHRRVVFLDRDVSMTQIDIDRKEMVETILELLVRLKWKKVMVLFENVTRYQNEVELLQKELFEEAVCLVAMENFTPNKTSSLDNVLKTHADVPVIILSSQKTTLSALKSLQSSLSHHWILPTSYDRYEIMELAPLLPAGSIIISHESDQNKAFSTFIRDINKAPSHAPVWYQQFCGSSRDRNCSRLIQDTRRESVSSSTNDIILHVDALLHGLHYQYSRRCPDQRGICDAFADVIISGNMPPILQDVNFVYQGEQLQYISPEKIIQKLSLFNKQNDKMIQVGTYFKRQFLLNASSIQFYNQLGEVLSHIPEIQCRNECECVKIFARNLSHVIDDHHFYSSQPGEFILESWAIAVVAVSGSGCFMSIVFAVYVIHKMCTRTIGKRYTFLGLALLLAVTVMYSAVLPFVFTPSETVCALRYFLTGVAYALCFAVILVKLMTLQSYKFIGLGGEVSGLNQAATVFFITCVQVSSGVHWWLYYSPFVQSSHSMVGGLMYACNMGKIDLSIYLAYVMFLLVACCLYSVGVRSEKRNMGEAKLLLSCSWLCLAVWLSWLLCLFLFDAKWSQVIVCASILGCASSVMLIVFIPKIRLVSRLKYDLSQKSAERNGYSIDTDFLYERPQSLPGTLTSTFSSGKASFPKTVTSFDSDLNQ